MAMKRLVLPVVLLLFFMVIAISSVLDQHYFLASFVLVILSMLPFFIRFERKTIHARELVIIALLASIAAVSRIPFAAIPSVQPTSFVVIVSGIVFGSESGFLVGAFAALVSNLFLMQGPWTPWQMLCWGMMGLTAGWLGKAGWMKTLWGKCVFGLVWGFLFGWIMNIWMITGYTSEITLLSIGTIFAASFYFDLAHALCNILFLSVFSTSWIRILLRVKRKYGLMEHN